MNNKTAASAPSTTAAYDNAIVNMERMVLTSIINNNDKIVEVSEELRSDDFYLSTHQQIYAIYQKLYKDNKPIDIEMIISSFTPDNRPSDDDLYAITQHTLGYGDIAAYVEKIKEASIKRRIRTIGAKMIDKSHSEEATAQAILDSTEREVFALSQNSTTIEFKDSPKLTMEVADYLEELKKRGNSRVTGIATPFASLDIKTMGFHGGELIIIGARPSMGKTAFVLNIANHLLDQNLGVAIISLEMPSKLLLLRMFSGETGIPLQDLMIGHLNDKEWTKVTETANKFDKKRLFINDGSNLNISQLKSQVRKLKAQHKIDILIIDYLQLMSGENRSSNENMRQQEVSEISRGLKMLARELDIPILALSQLNRGLESRDDKRPIISDLRESGSIEQDADVILFLYRDSVYAEREENARRSKWEKDEANKGKVYIAKFEKTPVEMAEILIAKNRNGETGTIKVQYSGAQTKWFEKGAIGEYDITPTQSDF